MAYDADTDDSEPVGSGAMPEASEGKDNGTLYRKMMGWWKEDISTARKWREEAKESVEFVDGYQWTEEEIEYLRSQKRPDTKFNYIANLIDAVVGAEISNRREVRYIPREIGDSAANELLTSSGEWFRDQSDAEDEESEAFRDVVIAGMGWVETRLSDEDNPDGDPVMSRIDPFEMVWDCRARKANLTDARRVWRVRSDLSIEDARALAPGVADSDLHASFANAAGSETKYTDHPGGMNYVLGQEVDDGGRPRKCSLVECQWIETEAYFRVVDPTSGGIVDVPEDRFALLKKAAEAYGFTLQAMPAKRKVVMRAFLGAKVLSAKKSPYGNMFTYSAMTGTFDRKTNTFYGLVRNAKDPQVWVNKLHSQIMHIMNTSAKGGIMAEDDAFADIREAEKTWAKPDGITVVAAGAIQNGKIQPKPQVQLPAGYFTMMQESQRAIREVTGINQELLGMRDANQPGVLEYQRKQAGMSSLSRLFNALRRYRKQQGKLMLYIIQTFLSDGRLVRVVGDEKAEYVPLIKPDKADIQYDIIVDDAPTSPNEKERTWQIIMAMMPQIAAMSPPPEVVLEMLRYSPLPQSLVEKLRRIIDESKSQPNPEAEIRKQVELAGATAKIEKDQASAAQSMASAKLDEAKAQAASMDAFAKLLGQAFSGLSQPTAPGQMALPGNAAAAR